MSMDKHEYRDPGSRAETPRVYEARLQPLMQSLLATLADIDFDYELEREKVIRSARDVNLRIRVLEKLRERHHSRREPYIQQLAILQERVRNTMEQRLAG